MLVEKVTKQLPDIIRLSLDTLSEDEVWWRPHPLCNSIGNIVLHVTGGLNEYIVRGIGGDEVMREREKEFAPDRRSLKVELLASFNSTIKRVEEILSRHAPLSAAESTKVVSSALHLSHHAGQVIYLAGMIKKSRSAHTPIGL